MTIWERTPHRLYDSRGRRAAFPSATVDSISTCVGRFHSLVGTTILTPMKRSFLLCLTIALILSTTHRAPAPIVEESPKPAATKPRPKSIAEPKPKPRPAVKPEPTPISYAGIWATNYNNELQVSQTANHVTGSYDGGRGVLDGTVNGNILSGTWAWRNQRGIFRFTLSGDGKSFSGTFSSSSGKGGPWTGVRKSP